MNSDFTDRANSGHKKIRDNNIVEIYLVTIKNGYVYMKYDNYTPYIVFTVYNIWILSKKVLTRNEISTIDD